jgi:hypothetical protein
MFSQSLPKCWTNCFDFITKEILIQPPQTPSPPTSPRKKITWIVGDQPLKFK